MHDAEELIAAARSHSVGIVGGGIAGLVVAFECAKIGIPVTVWGNVGGSIRTANVGGRVVDTGADTLRSVPAVDELLEQLSLSDQILLSQPWERFVDAHKVVEMPPSAALGIPTNPLDKRVVSIVGWRGAWRAYFDRIKPVLTIGNETNLASLVMRRMGLGVRDRLVAPHTRARYGLEPTQVLVNVAAPELNAALTRAGSLSGGVALLGEAPAQRTLANGLGSLIAALVTRITELGGTVHDGELVDRVERSTEGWLVHPEGEELEVEPATATEVTHLVIATDERSAHALLTPVMADVPAVASRDALVVTFATDAHGVRRGAGVLSGDARRNTVVVDHDNVRWQRDAGSDVDVFRVRMTDASLSDEDAVGIAVSEVSRQYGAELVATDSRVDRFSYAQSKADADFASRAEAVSKNLSAVQGLDVVGAWIAGADLADVITDARAKAEQIRRHTLFPEREVDASNGI